MSKFVKDDSVIAIDQKQMFPWLPTQEEVEEFRKTIAWAKSDPLGGVIILSARQMAVFGHLLSHILTPTNMLVHTQPANTCTCPQPAGQYHSRKCPIWVPSWPSYEDTPEERAVAEKNMWDMINHSQVMEARAAEAKAQADAAPHPTENDIKDPRFQAIWQAIKHWDIERYPGAGRAGATGTDVMAILKQLRENT